MTTLRSVCYRGVLLLLILTSFGGCAVMNRPTRLIMYPEPAGIRYYPDAVHPPLSTCFDSMPCPCASCLQD